MIVRDALLRATLGRLDDGVSVALDPGFQGLPDMAHGGTVLALFDSAARLTGARRVRGHYMKRVPLATALTLRRIEVEGCARFDLVDTTGTTLVDGEVTPMPEPMPPGTAATASDHPLPVSSSCFVCGVDNDIGLRATLGFDDDGVGAVWQAPERFRTPDDLIAPVALTALLDEGAFWLGALMTGESGMTTALDVTLMRAAPFGTPITIAGSQRRVVPHADDARYLDTEVVALDDRGGVLASARITFVAVRGAARRLAPWLMQTNDPEVVRRIFPTYARG